MKLPLNSQAWVPLKPGWRNIGIAGVVKGYQTHPIYGERALLESTDKRTFWASVEHMEAFNPSSLSMGAA